jgi:hypothetical protein
MDINLRDKQSHTTALEHAVRKAKRQSRDAAIAACVRGRRESAEVLQE